MSDLHTLDIVMPYHGDPVLFREAVLSVVGQTDPLWRLRVIEDGDDATFDAASWIRSLRDTRITHENNASRLGVAGNFQRSLEASTAPYVTFLGCDDRMLPEYVGLVRRLARRFPTADVLQPGVEVIDGGGSPALPVGDRIKRALAPRVSEPVEVGGERLVTSLLHGNWTYFPALCWRRESIARRGFRADLPTTLDLWLLADVLLAGGTMALDPTVVFQYRRHAASASSMTALSQDRFGEEARVLHELAERCAALGWTRAARAARWRLTSRAHHLLVRVTTRLSSRSVA